MIGARCVIKSLRLFVDRDNLLEFVVCVRLVRSLYLERGNSIGIPIRFLISLSRACCLSNSLLSSHLLIFFNIPSSHKVCFSALPIPTLCPFPMGIIGMLLTKSPHSFVIDLIASSQIPHLL